MRNRACIRAIAASGVMALIFSLFSWRLIYLQVDQSAKFAAVADRKQIIRQRLPAQRGAIRDIAGEVLADDMPMRRVVADPSRIKPANLDETTHLLANSLDLDEHALRRELAPTRQYVVLQHKVPEFTAEDLKAKLQKHNLAGVYLEPDTMRVYPNGSLLCHVVGFTDFEGVGVQGIEKTMNDFLIGHDGYRYITRDRAGEEIVPHRGVEQAPRNGCNVCLTVDMKLQSIVEAELDEAIKKYTPENATVIFTRPRTGEILAMASRPHFDVNQRGEAEPEQMKNLSVIAQIEPGSTFKIVTVGAVLNEKLDRLDTPVFCENGRWMYAGTLLHDAHPMGTLSVHDILMHSSNIGAAKLALQLGENKFYDYIKMMGFGDRTGIDLPGEISGRVAPLNQWSKISITHIPMGQEVAATPIQLAMAMGAIANGGRLMMPQIVHSITDEHDVPTVAYPPVMVRQTIRPEAARQVVAALEDVVSAKGTAKGAAVPGFRVAGKTGTAQKVNPHTHTYYNGKYVASFIGFFPAENPELLGLVIVDDPVTKPGEGFGGLVAGPIFASIAQKAAERFNLTPDFPIPPAPALASKSAGAETLDNE